MKKLTKHIAVVLSLAILFTMTAPISGPLPVLAAFAPQAALTAPAANATVTEPVNIVGTAAGTDVTTYSLEYAFGSDAFIQDAADVPWVQFASGPANIIGGVLGVLDTTNMENGYYSLRLTVFGATAAEAQSVSRTVLVEGKQKTNFSTQFIDLDIPVRGMPLTALRGYDSRVKHLAGDFGYG
jgi:hypothetical protein